LPAVDICNIICKKAAVMLPLTTGLLQQLAVADDGRTSAMSCRVVCR